MKNRATFYKIIFVNILLIVLLFAVFEWGVRRYAQHNQTFEERAFTNANYIPSAYTKFHPKANQKVYASINGQLNYDSVKYNFNSQGYRGSEIPLQKDSDEIRIAIIGGSHVCDPNSFDYEGNPGFPQLVQDGLRKRGFKVTVINAGVPGSCTKEFLLRAHFDISRFNPDYVVINSIWNDIKWITSFTKQTQFVIELPRAIEKNPLGEKIYVTDYLFGWSAIYRKIHDYYWNRQFGLAKDGGKMVEGITNTEPANTQPEERNFDEGYNQYRNNLALLINIIRQFKSVPVLAVEESLIKAGNTNAEKKEIKYNYIGLANHDELVAAYSNCGKIITELANENNLKVIDVGSEIKSLRYFSDHVHLTPEGSRKTAKFYADFFETLLKEKNNPSSSAE